MGTVPRTLAEWLAYQEQLHPRTIDLGLERVQRVAQRLELLPLASRSIIVGGTNGKGSTATLIAALAQAHGLRVGLFTSPHLQRYEERVRINGQMVQPEDLVGAFERIEAQRAPESLTFFEFNALAALWLFRAAGVQLAVLEVGLGGRLDATNLVAADVAVLCSVGLDHCDLLGTTREQIGAEKAGIFRPQQPVVLGRDDLPASVHAAIARLGCRAQIAGVDFHWRRLVDGAWDYRDERLALENLPAPALAGDIQYRNAATALAALGALREPGVLDPEAVGRALKAVRLAGRMQFIAGPIEWVLDVAHNPAAAAELAEELRRRPVSGRTVCVLGMLADKDVAGVVSELAPLVDHWVLCGISEPRGLAAAQLSARAPVTRASRELAVDIASGCRHAAQRTVPGDRVLVCGSFHSVGPALQWLGLY